MLKYYVEENNQIVETDELPEEDSWIALTDPNDDELHTISAEFNLPMEACRTALDLDERSRIEIEDNYTMLLINIPTREETSERELYTTIPLAMILSGDHIITVCQKDTHILRGFANGKERDFHPGKRSRFIFQILYAAARRYLIYLRLIEKKIDAVEEEFSKNQKNKELLELMKLQKSLVYFSTGLRSNESVHEKLCRTDVIKKYDEDNDLLEDVIVENRQAIEMAKINTEILNNLSNSFTGIISNNLNVAMKILAIITAVMAFPTMLFSAYGMNVADIPLATLPGSFWIVLAVGIAAGLVAMLVILKIKIFK